ncbi:MAG: hypothetical protein K6G68_06060 [Oscillospiraceae bacterium]|nr:hypothetical protein [Oscillospiraceae bacterium]
MRYGYLYEKTPPCHSGKAALFYKLCDELTYQIIVFFDNISLCYFAFTPDTDGEEHERAACVYIQPLHGLDEYSDEEE